NEVVLHGHSRSGDCLRDRGMILETLPAGVPHLGLRAVARIGDVLVEEVAYLWVTRTQREHAVRGHDELMEVVVSQLVVARVVDALVIGRRELGHSAFCRR